MEVITMVVVFVEGVAIDRSDKTLVLLRQAQNPVFLPIWIGAAEAMSIQIELENKQSEKLGRLNKRK